MIKKIISFVLILSFLFSLSGCNKEKKKYSRQYYDYLDTVSSFDAYCDSEEEFERYSRLVENELEKYHKYFDIYNSYEGISNVKTINDNAGKNAVTVDKEILKLISASKKYYKETNGKFNIALGSVLRLWHNERENAEKNPENARLPDINELKKAKENTNIEDIKIDEEKSQIYISNPALSLDLGGIAKGYTAQKITEELKKKGLESGLLNLGGNVYAIGKPQNKEKWKIGIESTDKNDEIIIADVAEINDTAVVSSGNYQRFYVVDGKKYHHIIDNDTLMPADTFKAVSVVHSDSEIADMLSTSLFLLSYEEGLEIVQKYNGEAIWYFSNGDTKMTKGFNSLRVK